MLLSGLKPNTVKYETSGIGALKVVSLALGGMDCIDLTKKLGIRFSYKKTWNWRELYQTCSENRKNT